MEAHDFLNGFKGKVRNSVLFKKSPKWLTSPEYAKQFNAKWYKVYERAANNRPPVVYYGSIVADLQRKLDSEFPEAGVLELNNALLYGKQGWIFSPEGYLLPDHSWYGRHVNEMGKVPRLLPRGRRLEGVCLSLASEFSLGNYGHFLLDCIGRLELFNKAGFKLSDVDHIFCPKPSLKNAQRLWDQLGISFNKCIWANDNQDGLVVETLLAPTFPGTRRNYPKWLPKFIQNEFLASRPSPSRRLYISRSGYNRNVINEEVIIRILVQYGFEIYDPAQHANPPSDFAESAIVVGPHGAGLTGLVFCQPGTKVLELIPTDHVYPYYYTLSDAAGLDYGCLVCKSTHEREPDAWGPSRHDFYVNEDELEQALVTMTSEI